MAGVPYSRISVGFEFVLLPLILGSGLDLALFLLLPSSYRTVRFPLLVVAITIGH